jgi:hypothetical protein
MYVQIQHYLKNDLKYKHTGATGKLVGVVSIEDITVYDGFNSTAMSAARMDLHHNRRKHVGLHAHQRLHRLPEDGLSGRPRLRVPRVVVLAGHLLAWLGSRQIVEPVVDRFVDTSTCGQDKRDEVVLVGVLHRFDRGVGLRCRQSRRGTTALVDIALGPGAHRADVEDPRVAVRAC